MISRRIILSMGLGIALVSSPLKANLNSPDYDVIIIGSGAAGLAAALTVAENGKTAVVLEKMPVIGGNSLLSTGLINAPDPERQIQLNIQDSKELFFQQTYDAGHRAGDKQLIQVLVDNALPTIHWLEKYGIHFKREMIQIYGGLWPRGHNPKVSHGRGYVNFLSRACVANGIPIKTNTLVTSFITEGTGQDKRVTGVKAIANGQEIHLRAGSGVIVATGGFSANKELCTQLDPRLKDMDYTGSPSATGEILSSLEAIGSELKDLKEIQCNLGPARGFAFRSGYHTDVKRHILVNSEGNRFVAEDGLRDTLRDAILNQGKDGIFIVVDSKGFQELSSRFQQNGASSEAKGYGWRENSIEELAEKIGIPPANLLTTIEQYNRAVDLKKDRFGREPWVLVEKIITPPFYATKARMAIHYTMGGVVIDPNARVISKEGTPIKGLYAAGEVTTGVHGTNRVGGNGILDAFVFGRVAGESAAKSL